MHITAQHRRAFIKFMSWLVALAIFLQPFGAVRAQTTTPEAPAAEVITNTAGVTGTIESASSMSATQQSGSLTVTIPLSDSLYATPVVTLAISITATSIPTSAPIATETPAPMTTTVAPAPAVSETMTAIVALSPTPTPSAVMTATNVPAAKKAKGGVYLAASTNNVVAGQIVEITLIALEEQRNNTLAISLSNGLEYVSGSHPTATFDATRRELTIKNPRIGERQIFRVQIQDIIKANDKNKLELAAGDASVRFKLGKKMKPQAIGKQGGRLTVDPRRIELDFAPDALKQEVTFQGALFESEDSPANGGFNPEPFRFTVLPETQFEAPVTATLDLSGQFSPAALPQGMQVMLFYYRETVVTETLESIQGTIEVTRTVVIPEPVPSTFDAGAMKLTAKLSHFSDYAPGFRVPSGSPTPWKLVPNTGGVSLYRGSANYSYAIDVPALPDGLQPQLSIGYSSAAADGGGEDDYRLGAGWGMDVPKITRGLALQKLAPSPGDNYWILNTSQDYRLSLNGQEQNLILKSSGANRWEYVTESYQPLRIVRCRAGTDCDGLGLTVPAWTEGTHVPYNTCDTSVTYRVPANQDYWQVWSPDGTRYVFGIDGSSTRRLSLRDGTFTSAYSQWYLRRVYSPIRDDAAQGRWSVEYLYTEEADGHDTGSAPGIATECNARGADWETNTRLIEIRYGNSLQQNPPAYYRVTFGYYGAPARLNTITTQAGGRLINQTTIGLGGSPLRVTSLIPQAWNGSGWAQRPSPTFNYVNGGRLLTSITNGYGASVAYDYWGIGGGQSRVNTRTINDGMGNVTVETYVLQPML